MAWDKWDAIYELVEKSATTKICMPPFPPPPLYFLPILVSFLRYFTIFDMMQSILTNDVTFWKKPLKILLKW